VFTEKFKHGLHNLRLGHFIVARLLWAAGYAQGRYKAKTQMKKKSYKSLNNISHNLIHHFLSNLNPILGLETIFKIKSILNKNGSNHFSVDVLNKKIFPENINEDILNKSSEHLNQFSNKLFQDAELSLENVEEFLIEFNFQDDRKYNGYCPSLDCKVKYKIKPNKYYEYTFNEYIGSDKNIF